MEKVICQDCKGNGYRRNLLEEDREELITNCKTCNNQGEINWNKDSIPTTPSLYLLEQRVLNEARYPDLHDVISNSQNTWDSEVKLGYRLSVSEENEVFSIIPIDLIDGQVSMTGTRQWSNSGKENTVSFALNAQTGEMLAWYYLQN